MKSGPSFFRGFLILIGFLGIWQTTIAQVGFRLPPGKVKDKIDFQLVNNLVVVPVEINGKELTFLLDTGVNYTLLFTLYESDSLDLKNVTPTKIRGLGEGGDIDALKSVNNTFKVGNAIDRDHSLYLIFDERINFSPRMGIPVHGVIGYEFFRDFVVKTDYDSQELTLYDPRQYKPKVCRKCQLFNLEIESNKAYVNAKVTSKGVENDVRLLLDTGASDALWLFDEAMGIDEGKQNYFNDLLGLGLSGAVNGKRSKIDTFTLGGFELERVNVSYPDSLALRNLVRTGRRQGTLGGDILRRFTTTLDYHSRTLMLKKNANFRLPFNYNMAGIVVEHQGMIPVKDVTSLPAESLSLQESNTDTQSAVVINVNPFYTFFLAPRLVVAEVREGSPADEVGIRVGDEVISINGKQFYDLELSEISALFSSRSGKRIHMVIDRNGEELKRKFVLRNML